MKKNKVVAALLAGALLVGGTFVGTKALFSSTATSNNHLALTTGKVKISVNEDEWLRNVVDKNNDDHITAGDEPYAQIGNLENNLEHNKDGVFANVQPGDTFTRRINVINQESTYDVEIAIAKGLNIDRKDLAKYVAVDWTDLKENTAQIPAGANISGYITVKIENTPEAWKAFNGAGTFNIDDTYTITATQK